MTTPANSAAVLDWQPRISALLGDIAAAQEELLEVLAVRRDRLARVDLTGLEALHEREGALQERLSDCQQRRQELLEEAERAGLPHDSVASLAQASSAGGRANLGKEIRTLSTQMRLLRNQSLTNWVLAQRSLLHVSQLLEIIASGGRMQPTYGVEDGLNSRGALVDQEA
jgi:flagellar biosynthesis/type III secretory pathway chaperone